MVEHQRLQFTVVRSAPEFPFQKSKANLHFAVIGLEVVVARTANDPVGRPLDHGERSFRFNGPIEVSLKDLPRVAIRFRMLLPNQRIAGRSKESLEVSGAQGAELNKTSSQRWLKVKFHGRACNPFKSVWYFRV